MSPVSAAAVSSLRARTGVSILACKDALEEAGGDEEKAIELLRKRGIAQAAKKADRMQGEGRLFAAESGSTAALVLLRCETDFVARSDAFVELGNALAQELLQQGEDAVRTLAEQRIPDAVQALGENISLGEVNRIEAPVVGTYVHSNGKIGVLVGTSAGTPEAARDVAMHAAASSPTFVRPEEVEHAAVESEKGIWREQLLKEGKPEAMLDKIMLGKEKKFREESALLTQPFVKDPSKTVAQFLGDADVAAYVRVSVS